MLLRKTGSRPRAARSDPAVSVDVRTASVFLHLTDIDRWPILDVRALHALGVPEPSSYGRRLWEAFVSTWRTLREQAAVDGRTFDRALWQWSKEHPDT